MFYFQTLLKILLGTVVLLSASTALAAQNSFDPLKELRDSLNTIRHKVNNHETEIRMYEDKINNQESIIDGLREQIVNSVQTNKDVLKDNSANLEMKIGSLETSNKGFVADLKQLKTHANETSSLLTQFQQKISELEKAFEAQNQNIENLQSAMRSLMAALDVKSAPDNTLNGSKTYQVKSGDSLEKIARKAGTTIKELKELNGLTKDRIIVGQTLQLP